MLTWGAEAVMLPVLDVSGLHAGYENCEIVHDVAVHVDAGEVVTIIGPNGAGKSTLLKALFGLCEVSAGTMRLGRTDLATLATHARVKLGMGYVPQVANVFPNLTIRENLDMGAYLLEAGAHDAAFSRVHALFPLLEARAREKAGRLSGGQRQMVAMGRALMMSPRILLLDEPSAGLAPNLQDDVFRNVRAVADAGTPVLLVEQNAKKALATSDRGYVLEMGRNRFEGSGLDLLADENVGRLYLGG